MRKRKKSFGPQTPTDVVINAFKKKSGTQRRKDAKCMHGRMHACMHVHGGQNRDRLEFRLEYACMMDKVSPGT